MAEQDGEHFFVLYYASGWRYMGLFQNRWTWHSNIADAAHFSTRGEAERAAQALKQEAADRISESGSGKAWPQQMWWDLHGGLLTVQEIAVRYQIIESERTDG